MVSFLGHPDHLPRLRIAAAGFFIQLALGAVYGWSIFLSPLQEQFGASKAATNLTFTITLAVLGITAGLGGGLQQRIGPRATATLAAFFYGSGVLLSGLAPNVIILYLTQGLMAGIGLGLGYIVPLAVLIGWFPDRRGFITGLAVTGFGLGALITSPLATVLIESHGVQPTLMFLGTAYFVIIVSAAQALRVAPIGYSPPRWTPLTHQNSNAEQEFTLREALRTPYWFLLWAILALNVTAGAALISVAAPLTQELAHVDHALSAIAVAVISLFNGFGRLICGAMSDRFGRARVFFVLFLLQSLTFAVLPAVDRFALLLIPIAIIALCYGGGFGIMPAFASDVFGAKNAGTIYGSMLTAWSAGAIAGPLLITTLPYRTALPIISVLLALAAALPILHMTLMKRRGLPASGALVSPSAIRS